MRVQVRVRVRGRVRLGLGLGLLTFDVNIAVLDSFLGPLGRLM